ncbi:1,4-alpha-glucan branching protein domain-containing protein [Paenibacillus terrigena]|uniref:1,4-alpha-glucan branching protein domain-containing protein n=1 Tax=Paenibacillus terrigena TaxID=369333 RepID=UPI000368D918|nr:1,4-alpha-glucan branching protein domain-containing protein [Paenibacillus terrigena]
MVKGYLSLVLHAHLPFVHHPESEDYIEERWLFEAMTETYLPQLDVFEGLLRDGVDFRITMSLTPTLLSMLASPLLQERYLSYLNNLIELATYECERTEGDESFHPLAVQYLEQFEHIKDLFVTTYQGRIIDGFRKFQDAGNLELITSAATHAFLPYVKTEQAIRSQIENAISVHTTLLGRSPRGIWLPECGMKEGLDRILKDYGIDFFFTDTHSLNHASPKPRRGVYGPVVTPHGVAAFARDQETSKQVWSSLEGYPGDYDYREYYRDIGYDLNYEYIKPYLHKTGVRLHTGIKYYRITGQDGHKEPYRPSWAEAKASNHAGNFFFNRERQVEHLAAHMDRKPIIIASYDAELFGHWWYEGPRFIDQLCRKAHDNGQIIQMITPAEYLHEYHENEQCQLAFSSWGRAGYGEVWLGQDNAWIYRHLHRMEEQMIELADRFPNPTDLEQRALNQAAKQLMLAESSDWAFIMDNKTMVPYAVKRTQNHMNRFQKLYRALRSGMIDEAWLQEAERRDDIFPALDYQIYRSYPAATAELHDVVQQARNGLKILMFSWEFPPMTVGGLSRHVYDLTRSLTKQGMEVHVITSHVNGYPAYEVNQGVHVHRVRTYQAHDLSFMEWVFQLNLAMTDYCKPLIAHYGPFDLIHAHDWLVCQAATALKHQFHLPLVATIHATEHGRNQGIYSELQHAIHHLEWKLTYEAWRVIGCSRYMEEELLRLFQLPADKLDTIANGVDSQLLQPVEVEASVRAQFARPDERIVYFVGRLVREKGVHILLDSIPTILASCPNTKFIISGKGPVMEELQAQARQMNVDHHVLFTGFIDDTTRNQLFQMASIAVFPSLYEPFGIVALEAMAAGTPVIVSGTGGLQEMVNYGEDGYTVLPGDVPSLASHVIQMLQNPDLARSMAQQAVYKLATAYNWDHIARQTIHTYHRTLHREFDHLAYQEVAATEDLKNGMKNRGN